MLMRETVSYLFITAAADLDTPEGNARDVHPLTGGWSLNRHGRTDGQHRVLWPAGT
ncbi:MAG: hypothetical protein QOG79_7620, partial [Mycobacterium sp.]|nr:hypothetical protein [Mycobacterium sp.]